MALDDDDLLVMDDFYSAGLAAAELVEQGNVDAAEDILRCNLAGVTDPKYQQAAQDILARLDDGPADDSTHGLRVKRRSLELMLLVDDRSEEKKSMFVERYSSRSVKHLGLARTNPRHAIILERLEDTIEGIAFAGECAIRGTAYGLLGPTGIRKFFEYAKKEGVSSDKFIVCSSAYTFTCAAVSTILYAHGYNVPLFMQAAFIILAGSGAYELARLAKRAYDRHRSKARPSASTTLLPKQSAVKARVETNYDNDAVPVYIDVGGNEERVHAMHEDAVLPAKKMVL